MSPKELRIFFPKKLPKKTTIFLYIEKLYLFVEIQHSKVL